jgi:RND family efflux transporter MFP subunit
MLKKAYISIFCTLLFFYISSSLYAVEKRFKGMPPARVVISKVRIGMIAPENEFIGTVYYQEVSDVASEISGKVEEVNFEEGQRIGNKDVSLVKLNSDLLLKTLDVARANYAQTLSELKKAKKEFKRAKSLYKENLLSDQSFDEYKFRVEVLEMKSASLKAEVERLNIELQKKIIKAPFEGVVIQKHVNRGEWLSPGSIVVTIARDDFVDIIVEVPQSSIAYITNGMTVNITIGNSQLKGKVIALIPKGDIPTRTFPVKIRVRNTSSLKEGMEAVVRLPIGKKEKAFIVPRDALITVYGKTVVFTVQNSKAVMIPVQVIGYQAMNVGIQAEGLKEGMNVVVKGNERLRDGQPVITDNHREKNTD